MQLNGALAGAAIGPSLHESAAGTRALLGGHAGGPRFASGHDMHTNGLFGLSVSGDHAVTRVWGARAIGCADQTAVQTPYSVFEYLAGQNLDEVLASWGALPVTTAVDWILQAAEGVAGAHARWVPHGSLTPASLIVTRRADGRPAVELADRGVPRRSSAHYMAPEQLRSPPEGGVTSDVWALGAILHEMLSAQPAFRGQTRFEVCAAVHLQPAPRLSWLRHDVEPGLEAVVQRCLDKDPAARFANVREMAWSLATFGSDEARSSCERIEATFRNTRAPLAFEEHDDIDAREPDSEVSAFRVPASPKIVFAGLGMLVLVGMGLFAWMYVSVHDIDLATIIGY
jgi:serine/threonine protein kinase